MDKFSRGILIMALGHPYYGRMAHNLAVSIKAAEPDIPIALCYGGDAINHLSVFDISYFPFDQTFHVDTEYVTRNGKTEWIKAKTHMYDLSPFDETIFLDADMIWLPNRKPSELFEQLKDVEFTVASRGCIAINQGADDYIQWAKLSEIRSAYGLTDEKYYQVSSEFVYFKRSDRMKSFFASVRDNYDDLKVKHRPFANGIPDELPFALAMMQHKIYPHEDRFTPIFWQHTEKNLPTLTDLYKKYFALSAGGKFSREWTKRQYDRLVQHYFNGAGLRYIWKLQNKRSFLPERAKA